MSSNKHSRNLTIAPTAFIKILVESGFERRKNLERKDDCEIHFLDLTPLKIRSYIYTPFLVPMKFSGRGTISDVVVSNAIEYLLELIKTFQKDYLFLVIGAPVSRYANKLIRRQFGNRCIPIFQDGIKKIIASPRESDKARALGKLCVDSVGLYTMSPYILQKPAQGYRFFGRRSLIRRLVGRTGQNFTIVGNRRIGKTSVLKEIRRRLTLEDPDSIAVEIYGASTDCTEDVIIRLLRDGFSSTGIGTAILREANPKRLVSEIRNFIEKQNRNLLVFIDELDRIIDWDSRQNYQFLNILRELSQSENCRLFFAGFRETMKAKSDVNNPLFNFTTFEVLGPIPREESIEMVQKPMQNMGLEVSDGLCNRIYRQSGGHPELIQTLCSAVIDFAQEEDRLPIETELIDYVINSWTFETSVVGAFRQNCTLLEQLACYLLIQQGYTEHGEADQEFLGRDLSNLLKKVLSELKQTHKLVIEDQIPMLIQNLTENIERSGTITRVVGSGSPPKYKFSVPSFANYCITKDLEAVIEETIRQIIDFAEAGNLAQLH